MTDRATYRAEEAQVLITASFRRMDFIRIIRTVAVVEEGRVVTLTD